MDMLYALRDMEKSFQEFFVATGFQTLTEAITPEEFDALQASSEKKVPSLLQESLSFLSPSLSEADYFSEREDISALQHLRFMPAIYHVGEFFELECVLSGKVTCFVENRCLTLSPRDVLILSPGTRHAASTYEETGIMVNILVRQSTFEKRFLHLLPDADIIRGFFQNALYHAPSSPYLLFPTGDGAFLQRHILPLLHECERNSRYKNTMLGSQLSMFLVELLRSYEKDVIIPTLDPSVMSEDTLFILEYMQKNIATISLSHLAEFFNYSERQMRRIIKVATGLSFSEIKEKLRMQMAEELLKGTSRPVADIADYLGYCDVSAFRKAFRLHSQKSPSQYRQEAEVPQKG